MSPEKPAVPPVVPQLRIAEGANVRSFQEMLEGLEALERMGFGYGVFSTQYIILYINYHVVIMDHINKPL